MDELDAMKAKMENARAVAAADVAVGSVEGLAPGMTVGKITEDAEEQDGAEPLPPKKMPGRKTKQQRKKAERLRAEVRAPRSRVTPNAHRYDGLGGGNGRRVETCAG